MLPFFVSFCALISIHLVKSNVDWFAYVENSLSFDLYLFLIMFIIMQRDNKIIFIGKGR